MMPDETDNKCWGAREFNVGDNPAMERCGKGEVGILQTYSLKAMETEITSGHSDHLAPQRLYFTFL